MSLDKAIEHGKEKRKPYIGAKSIAHSCRNHGSCKWCENNRKHKFRDKHPLDTDELKGASPLLIADDWGGDVAQRCQRERCAIL